MGAFSGEDGRASQVARTRLVTYLIQAAEGGDKLTDREALTLMKLAMIAGNDLTTQAIALTLDCLLENPEQMRLVADTCRSPRMRSRRP